MSERINRETDENLYQPTIHSDRVRALYSLKLETGKPMTVLLDQAIHELAIRYGAGKSLTDDLDMGAVSAETWEEICEYKKFLDDLDYQKCLDDLQQVKNAHEA